MARLDERTEQFIREFSGQMRELYGEDLLSVILYGSAAGPHFLPGISDVNLLIVLKELKPDRLQEVIRQLRRFRRECLEPLFLASSELAALAAVYPIEILEMKEQHRVVHGSDVLKTLHISTEKIHDQLIHELMAKSLRVRSVYLECGEDARQLEEALSSIVSSFGVLMRTILRLSDQSLPPPQEFLEIITQLEERFGLDLRGFRDAFQVKTRMRRFLREELHRLFAQILHEAEILSRRAPEILRTGS